MYFNVKKEWKNEIKKGASRSLVGGVLWAECWWCHLYICTYGSLIASRLKRNLRTIRSWPPPEVVSQIWTQSDHNATFVRLNPSFQSDLCIWIAEVTCKCVFQVSSFIVMCTSTVKCFSWKLFPINAVINISSHIKKVVEKNTHNEIEEHDKVYKPHTGLVPGSVPIPLFTMSNQTICHRCRTQHT
jgi:hypothetical protein